MLGQLREPGLVRSTIPQFSIHVRSSRLVTFLAMLRMIGYAPKVIRAEESGDGSTEIVIEMGGSERMPEILLAWLRTIPGVEVVKII